MNLAQIATVVGQRLGVDTSSGLRDGAAVRSFLTMRHDQLYRAFLWRDSIIELETPINQPYTPTSIYMPTKARLILPSIFQHVLGVRLGWRGLNVQRPMLYTRADYGAFMSSGFTAEFMSLSSCVWEFDTVQNLFLQASNAADNNVGVTIDELQADEVSIARSVVNILQVGAPAGSTDRVDNLIKAITLGQVSLCFASASGNAPVSVVGISYVGSPVPTATVNVTQGVSYTITPGANENGIVLVNGIQTITLVSGIPISVTSQGTQFLFQYPNLVPTGQIYAGGSYVLNGLSPAVAYNIYWQPGTNEFRVSPPTGGIIFNPGIGQTSTTQTGSGTNNMTFLEVGGQGGNGLVTSQVYIAATGLPLTATITSGLLSIITIQASDLSAPKCQRIQLVGKPTTTGQQARNLHVLGKRVTPPFSDDSDVPGINGLDGVLVALACYDFRLYRDEGGADSSASLIEAVGPQFISKGVAGGFLGKLIEEEVIQAASNSRIIPEHGFGGAEYYSAGGWNTKGSPY